MHTKTLLSETVVIKRVRGKPHIRVRDDVVKKINVIIPNVGKDIRAEKLIMRMKDISNWEHVARNKVW